MPTCTVRGKQGISENSILGKCVHVNHIRTYHIYLNGHRGFQSRVVWCLFEGGYYFDSGVKFIRAMASQVEKMFCLDSVVYRHHIYKTVWTPFLGEILTTIPEPENNHDRHAVCIKKGTKIVGHVSSTGVPLALLFASSTLKLSSHQFHIFV